MIIQCPACPSRYRIKDVPPGHPDTHLQCPKCQCRFVLVAPTDVGAEPLVRLTYQVLIVDDARFFREMLADLLKPLRLNLQQAENAHDALTALKNNSYDLVLLDLNLPDKNGLELISELRADHQLEQTRVLAMSGVYRREGDAVEAIRAGADAFICKSFRPADLREKVKKLLAG